MPTPLAPTTKAFYAHTAEDGHGNRLSEEHWEPLFTPNCPALKGEPCEACANLHPRHGHLNKVAHLAAKFASEMFAHPPGTTRFQPAPDTSADTQAPTPAAKDGSAPSPLK